MGYEVVKVRIIQITDNIDHFSIIPLFHCFTFSLSYILTGIFLSAR
jgi:hypothetical protein